VIRSKVDAEPEAVRLTAYVLSPGARVEPASRWREWMNATEQRFANRCLPLLMANQAGWHISLEHAVHARWEGGTRREAVVVESASPIAPKGHFGHGILTWHVPFLFRTDPGWNLLVRGPANLPKDGIAALEGLVESDWATATFTMNWRFTRPGEVTWLAGEPFAMVLPQRRGQLEAVRPRLAALDESPEEHLRHCEWRDSRNGFIGALRARDPATVKRGWERHYFRGRTPCDVVCGDHQTVLRLAPFDGAEPAPTPPHDGQEQAQFSSIDQREAQS
jgi:hypothetical protein